MHAAEPALSPTDQKRAQVTVAARVKIDEPPRISVVRNADVLQ
jgi:hypothetical protein